MSWCKWVLLGETSAACLFMVGFVCYQHRVWVPGMAPLWALYGGGASFVLFAAGVCVTLWDVMSPLNGPPRPEEGTKMPLSEKALGEVARLQLLFHKYDELERERLNALREEDELKKQLEDDDPPAVDRGSGI